MTAIERTQGVLIINGEERTVQDAFWILLLDQLDQVNTDMLALTGPYAEALDQYERNLEISLAIDPLVDKINGFIGNLNTTSQIKADANNDFSYTIASGTEYAVIRQRSVKVYAYNADSESYVQKTSAGNPTNGSVNFSVNGTSYSADFTVGNLGGGEFYADGHIKRSGTNIVDYYWSSNGSGTQKGGTSAISNSYRLKSNYNFSNQFNAEEKALLEESGYDMNSILESNTTHGQWNSIKTHLTNFEDNLEPPEYNETELAQLETLTNDHSTVSTMVNNSIDEIGNVLTNAVRAV